MIVPWTLGLHCFALSSAFVLPDSFREAANVISGSKPIECLPRPGTYSPFLTLCPHNELIRKADGVRQVEDLNSLNVLTTETFYFGKGLHRQSSCEYRVTLSKPNP